MINIIDNFKKLDEFYYIEINNNFFFRNSVYYDFMEIFNPIMKNEDNITTFSFDWNETKTREEIYNHFENKFIISNSDTSDSENGIES